MELSIKDHIRPVSDFRKDTAQLLKKLKQDRHPIVLTQRGRSVAVIIDVETYERLDYEHYVRRSMKRGLEDLKAGRSVPHDQVMKEAKRIIESYRSK